MAKVVKPSKTPATITNGVTKTSQSEKQTAIGMAMEQIQRSGVPDERSNSINSNNDRSSPALEANDATALDHVIFDKLPVLELEIVLSRVARGAWIQSS